MKSGSCEPFKDLDPYLHLKILTPVVYVFWLFIAPVVTTTSIILISKAVKIND